MSTFEGLKRSTLDLNSFKVKQIHIFNLINFYRTYVKIPTGSKNNSMIRYRHFRNKTLTLKDHLESNMPTLK